MVREALAGLLTRTGRFNVVGTAGDVKEALRMLEACRPAVVIADLSLPDSNAIDIVRALEAKRDGARVLIMTGFSQDFYAAELLEAGAAGYIFKHQPTAELFAAIDMVASGKTYVSPAVAQRLREAGEGAAKGSGLDSLTPRENEILRLVVRGRSSKELSKALGIGLKTVDTHRTNINRKLGVRTTAALIRFAVAHGIDIGASSTAAGGAVVEDVLDVQHLDEAGDDHRGRRGQHEPGRAEEEPEEKLHR